jgi:hypothetical protein
MNIDTGFEHVEGANDVDTHTNVWLRVKPLILT